MATDYYQMGLGLGGAYFKGEEQKRQNERQQEHDARVKKQFENQQTVFDQAQADRAEVDAATADDAPAQGSGVPAAPIGSRDVAPPAGLPTQGSAPNAPGAGVPEFSTDPQIASLQQAVRLGKANRHLDRGQSYNTAQKALAGHIRNIGYGAQAKGVMEASDEQLQPLYAHVIQNSKSIRTMEPGKGGYTMLAYLDDGGALQRTKLSRAELARMVVGEAKLQHGDLTGMDDITAVHSGLAAAVAKEMGMAFQVNTANNTARHQANQDATAARNADANVARASRENATSARLNAKLDREEDQERIAGEAAGLRQGFERAKALPESEFSAYTDPATGKTVTAAEQKKRAADIYAQEHNNAQTRGAGLGVKIPSINERPPVDPARYFAALKSAMEVYNGDEAQARMAVDREFGRAQTDDDALVKRLQSLNEKAEAKAKAKVTPPVHSASGLVTPDSSSKTVNSHASVTPAVGRQSSSSSGATSAGTVASTDSKKKPPASSSSRATTAQ